MKVNMTNVYFSPICKQVSLQVVREGNQDFHMTVEFKTKDMAAKSNLDYESCTGSLHFAPGVRQLDIDVALIKHEGGANVELDNTFAVQLSSAINVDLDNDIAEKHVCISNDIATVYIVPQGGPGVFNLECPSFSLMENQEDVQIKILRSSGYTGDASVKYETKDGTAVANHDFVPASGTLTFSHGEVEKLVTIKIIDDDVYEADETFSLKILEPSFGATIGLIFESQITILNDDVIEGVVQRLKAMLNYNDHKYKRASRSWRIQFAEAISPPPKDERTPLEMALYVVVLPWSALCGAMPPPDIYTGWPRFLVSLTLTGICTGLIGDFAALFGCVLGLSDYVTAITIVALGTSLPDTFASIVAAKADRSADAAIVNVTGSNAVNVFLGLGIAWMIGACYWEGNATEEWVQRVGASNLKVVAEHPNGVLFVDAGTISLSVGIYAILAMSTIGILYLR